MTTLDQPLDQTARTPDEVAGRVIGIVNSGAICVLTSVGEELGLFDTLAGLPPVTSVQLADAAGLDERYVREWLGGMVTAEFVLYDPTNQTYRLCPDHAPFLTGPGVDNLGRTTRYLTLMGEVTPQIVERFRSGGGLSYADYPNFHALMALESAAVNDASLIDTIIPLTGEVDRLRAGISVADFGCGSGHAINLLAREFPNSSFVGYDISDEALEVGRAEAAAWGLTNATFVAQDVAALEVSGAYDLVTAFDTVHDQAQPAVVLQRIRQAIRPGGTFLMIDINASSNLEENIALPWATLLYTFSTMHCMSVSLGQGGVGLGTVWGRQLAEQMVRDAGFSEVVVHDLEQDPFNAYFVARA